MSDDIFIKQDQVLGQQPYIARVPKNAQEPNIRQQRQPTQRTAQQPSTYQNRTPTTYRDPRSTQNPFIRNARQPLTYNHRSPLQYDHRSPTTYQHRSPFTYNHRSPSTYQHRSPSTYQDPRSYQDPSTYNHRSPFTYRDPVSYQVPFTYQHRSPLTYDHRSPFTYDHRSPFTYDHRSPSTYQNRQPNTYDHRSPFTYQHRSPFTYQHRSPSTYQNRQPNIYNHPSPFTYNIQTPSITQQPVIFDAIDGDSTGPTSTPQGFSQQLSSWVRFQQAQAPQGYVAQANATIAFHYQTSSTTGPHMGSGQNEQGSVHVYMSSGNSNSGSSQLYSIVSIGDNISGYPSNLAVDIDDTWSVQVKYNVSAQAAQHGGHTPADTSGGNKALNTYYTVYSGSSSANSFNGTATNRIFQWKAQNQLGGGFGGGEYSPQTSSTSAQNLVFTIKLSKSGQTDILTTASYSSGGFGGGFGAIDLRASSGTPFF